MAKKWFGQKDKNMRKVYVDIKVRLIITADEGVDINNVVNEMNTDFVSTTDGAEIQDAEITETEIINSK